MYVPGLVLLLLCSPPIVAINHSGDLVFILREISDCDSRPFEGAGNNAVEEDHIGERVPSDGARVSTQIRIICVP